VIGFVIPLTIAGDMGFTSTSPFSFRNVLSLISISPPFAILCSLAAIFTGIPIEVNSLILNEPKMPEKTLPVDMPIPIFSLKAYSDFQSKAILFVKFIINLPCFSLHGFSCFYSSYGIITSPNW
jgi:hypothetical protein